MSRSIGEMTKEEKQLHAIYKGRLDNDLCTKVEKEDALKQIDILEQKGAIGEAMKMIRDFEERLAAVELIKGRGKQAFTKSMFEELTATIERAKSRIDAGVVVNVDSDAAIAQNREEINGLWADRRKSIETDAIAATTLVRIERTLQEMREQHAHKVLALEASDTKILKALADLLADSVEEARIAIGHEVEKAAITAVEKLVGSLK